MKLVFSASAKPSSTPCQPDASHAAVTPDETVLFPKAAMRPNMSLSEEHYRPLLELIKSFDLKNFPKSFFEEPLKSHTDPYLFVLLAEQELGEGREEQALCLIEAAFSAFDQGSTGDDAQFSG